MHEIKRDSYKNTLQNYRIVKKNTDRFKLWGEHRITKEGFSPLINNVYPAGAVRLKGGAVYRWMANKSIWVQL